MSSRQRVMLTTLAAVLVHVLVIALIPRREPPRVSDNGPSVAVTLRTASPPAPAPAEQPVPVVSRPPPPPVVVSVVEPPSPEPRVVAPEPAAPAPAPAVTLAPPPPSDVERVREIIQSLDRFNLDAPETDFTAAPEAPRQLGRGMAGPTVAMMLDHDEIDLPSADTPMDLRFYSGGVQGDMERLGDAVTKTWAFKTPGGMEVKCAWVLVIFTCGW